MITIKTEKEKTEEMIRIMQAFIDGKQIQIYHFAVDEWIDENHPVWNWLECDYRIKPEP